MKMQNGTNMCNKQYLDVLACVNSKNNCINDISSIFKANAAILEGLNRVLSVVAMLSGLVKKKKDGFESCMCVCVGIVDQHLSSC